MSGDQFQAPVYYANFFQLSQFESDMALDCGIFVGPDSGRISARVQMTPTTVKRLVGLLQDQLSKFEKIHGSIKLFQPSEEGIEPLPMKKKQLPNGDGTAVHPAVKSKARRK